jgi:hypothetical protein
MKNTINNIAISMLSILNILTISCGNESTSTKTSTEDIFYMKINSAKDEAAMKRILNDAANSQFVKKWIQKNMINNGGKTTQVIEYAILNRYNKSQDINRVKTVINDIIDRQIESPFKDEIMKYYDDCIDDIFTGSKAEDVFGREVKDPRSKSPDSSNLTKEVEIVKKKRTNE